MKGVGGRGGWGGGEINRCEGHDREGVFFGWPSTMPTPAKDRPGQGGLTNLSTGPITVHGPGRSKQAGRYLDQVNQQVGWYCGSA